MDLLLYFIAIISSVVCASYKPIFNDAVSEVRAIAGQTAILPCSVKNKGSHIIIWMNPKRILFSTEENIVINDGRVGVESSPDGDWNLRIQHVRYNDSGEYSCQINTSPVKIKRVRLFVQVPSHILSAESSRDMDVEEGNNVTLTCKATGVPQPRIQWLRRPFENPEKQEYLEIQGETLHIPDVRRFQAGYYVCLAFNDVEPAVSREIAIRVQYPPVVKVRNTRLGQSLGKKTMLVCNVTSYPRSRIDWLKDDVVVKHSYKYRTELFPGIKDTHTYTLEILRINTHDYGSYTCEAVNRMGKDRSSMILYEYKDSVTTTTTELVTTKPKAPITTPMYDYYWVGQRQPFNVEEYVVLTDGRRVQAEKHPGRQSSWISNSGPASGNTAVDIQTGVCMWLSALVVVSSSAFL